MVCLLKIGLLVLEYFAITMWCDNDNTDLDTPHGATMQKSARYWNDMYKIKPGMTLLFDVESYGYYEALCDLLVMHWLWCKKVRTSPLEKGELATVKKSRYPEMRRRRAAGQSQEMDLVQSLLWSGTALPASIRQTLTCKIIVWYYHLSLVY